uniref:Uncharacterized protein LOC111129036 n=1 Tax=Crassostrea virginica TaxID=6565 RepID=A0A8B8DUY5_CRAVI|nr:uncharacterized protein LOC111129036 [Crassostrea virginica]
MDRESSKESTTPKKKENTTKKGKGKQNKKDKKDNKDAKNTETSRTSSLDKEIAQNTEKSSPPNQDKKGEKKTETSKTSSLDKEIAQNTEESTPSNQEEDNAEYSEKNSKPNQESVEKTLEVCKEETLFWETVIAKHLKSKITENLRKKESLTDLRNGVFAGFVMINLIYITVVFVITQANELNSDVFTVRLPCPNRSGTFDVDPISVVFTITFGLVLFLQFVGMLIHRFSTFMHIVAVSNMSKIISPKKYTKSKTIYDNSNDLVEKSRRMWGHEDKNSREKEGPDEESV